MKTSCLIRVSALLLFGSSICAAQAQKLRAVTVKNVTGHYRLTKDEFRNRLDLQQVTGGKIKFYLVALWVSHYNPDNIHNGELNGVLALQNGIAVYDQDACKLKFEFFSNRVRVTQLNDEGCGFGANVTAAGTYRKLDSKQPKFDF